MNHVKQFGKIQQCQTHRNGISGAAFHVLIFHDLNEGRMLGIVFEQKHHVAVFNLDKLALGNITFGENSWRGDVYEPYLRQAIDESENAVVSDESGRKEV